MREEVAQAALLRRRLAGFRQRQRVLQLLEDAPAARQSWGYARLALPATCCFAGVLLCYLAGSHIVSDVPQCMHCIFTYRAESSLKAI